jgi:hypothetical protein
MPKENTENKVKIQQVKEALIYGEINEKGKRTYPSLKAACEKIGANYDSVRHQVKVKDLKEERARVKAEMDAAIKKEKSDHQTEESVIGDDKFKKDADLLRIATTLKIQKIKDDLDNGFDVSSYHLMNAGKALESAQKVYKTAVGEPSDISQVEGGNNVNVNVTPAQAVADLEKELSKPIDEKSFEDVINEMEPDKDEDKL